MKQPIFASIKTFIWICVLTMMGEIAYAQDTTATQSTTVTHTTNTETMWYASPIVWIIGGVILILLIVALTRGKTTEKVVVTKTTTTD